MRFVRFALRATAEQGAAAAAQWGRLDGEGIVALDADPTRGPAQEAGFRVPLAEARLLAPVLPGKVVAVGRNYLDHIAEMGWSDSEPPVVFLKPSTAVIGPGRSIALPPESSHCEAEGELAVVIGRSGRRIPVERAAEHIFGYTIANDVSARDLMASDGQWARAKGFDSFCPLGPWLDTGFDPSARPIRTEIDGEVVQLGDTAQMRLGVLELVSWLSGAFRLEPGDVILTGSPAGRRRLAHGMAVSITIEGLGTLANPVIGERAVA